MSAGVATISDGMMGVRGSGRSAGMDQNIANAIVVSLVTSGSFSTKALRDRLNENGIHSATVRVPNGNVYSTSTGPNGDEVQQVTNGGWSTVSISAGPNGLQGTSTSVGGVGALSSAIEYSLPKVKIGSNGKLYWSGWNGGSRARITTFSIAEGAKLVGDISLLTGTAIDIALVVNGDMSATHGAVNLAAGVWGLSGGPFTAAPAAMYWAIDNFYPGGGIGLLQDKAAIDNRMMAIDPSWMHPGSH